MKDERLRQELIIRLKQTVYKDTSPDETEFLQRLSLEELDDIIIGYNLVGMKNNKK